MKQGCKKGIKHQKYNWRKLKTKYLKGKYIDLSDFSKKENINYSTLCQHSMNWKKSQKEIEVQAEIKTKEILTNQIAEANAKHLKIANMIQGWANESLFRVTIDKDGKEQIEYLMHPETAREAIISLKDGIEIERDTLGLNKQEVSITIEHITTTINKIIAIIKEEVTNVEARDKIAGRIGAVLSEANTGSIDAEGESRL